MRAFEFRQCVLIKISNDGETNRHKKNINEN